MAEAKSSAAHGPSRLTQVLFRVRQDEAERTLVLASLLFCAFAIQVLARTARDTLFLARYDPRDLPWMFVAYGAVSAVVAVLFSRAGKRFRLDHMLLGTLAVTAGSYVVAYALILADVGPVYPAFYVWADVTSGLVLMEVWGIAASLHTPKEAKRLFGVIGAGGVLGMVVGGLISGALVSALGTAGLLLVVIGLTGVVAWLTFRVRLFPAPAEHQRHDLAQGPGSVTGRYVTILGVVLVLTFTVAQVADYQFKLIARATYDELALARYFSLFYAGVGAFALFFQLFATPRILERSGILAALMFMPVLLGAGSLFFLFAPSVAAATVLKFGDAGFQFTINQSGLQLLYLPLPAPRKPRLLLFLEGMMKPVGYAAGGMVLLLVATRVSLPMLSLVSLPLVGVWLALLVAARRGYVGSLAASLDQRRALPLDEIETTDRAAQDLLRRTLQDPDPARARFAADRLLASEPTDMEEILGSLLGHQDSGLRLLALREIRNRGLSRFEAAVCDTLRDPVPRVRAEAAEAAASLCTDPVAVLEELLADQHERVREAAVTGLLRTGTIESVLAAGGPLLDMTRSPDRRDRAVAARVLGRTANPRFARPLAKLLEDPDKSVRREAARSAQNLCTPALLPPLVAAAQMPGSRAVAAKALRAYGGDAVGPLAATLSETVDPETRRHLIKTLRAIGTDEAATALLRRLRHEDNLRVRRLLWKSVERTHVRPDRPLPAWCDLDKLVNRELGLLYQLAQGLEAIEPLKVPLLTGAVENRLRLVQRLLFRALTVRYRSTSVLQARKGFSSESSLDRANAQEILANVLSREDRQTVLPYFDSGSAEQRLLRVAGPLGLKVRSAPDVVTWLAASRDAWLEICAFHAAALRGLDEVRPVAVSALERRNPLVREVAALTLALLERRPLTPEEKSMSDLLEKVVLLKGVSLFADVPGEDLAAVARTAQEIQVAAGEVFIQEGQSGDTLYVIVDGLVRVERGGQLLAHLGPGECVGELSVIDQEPRSATVVGEKKTNLLAIEQEDFHELLADHPELASSLLRLLCQRLRAADAREAAREPSKDEQD